MKIYFHLLALYSFPSASAFIVQVPKAPKVPALHDMRWDGGMNRGMGGRRVTMNEIPMRPMAPRPPMESRPGFQEGPSQPLSFNNDVRPSDPRRVGGLEVDPIDDMSEDGLWSRRDTIRVQGNTLKTTSFGGEIERVLVAMRTPDGRPLDANVELWQGPDNTPQKMSVYVEDGALRPFSMLMETPLTSNAVTILNTGAIEYPLEACIQYNPVNLAPLFDEPPRRVQGGALMTKPFPPNVESLAIMLETDGRPLNAKIELLQGPNNSKQVIEIMTENGIERPFTCVVATPGVGNVVRIVNMGSMEYPIMTSVEPYLIVDEDDARYESPEKPSLNWT